MSNIPEGVVIQNAQCFSSSTKDRDRIIEILKVLEHSVFKISPTVTQMQIELGSVHVAVANNEIVGVMVLVESGPWRKALEIEKIAVAEAYKNKGIGRSLLEHAEKIARRQYVRLEVSTRKEYNSVGFYKKCGYEVIYVDDKIHGLKKDLYNNKR